jgi:hypothetical protein
MQGFQGLVGSSLGFSKIPHTRNRQLISNLGCLLLIMGNSFGRLLLSHMSGSSNSLRFKLLCGIDGIILLGRKCLSMRKLFFIMLVRAKLEMLLI